jgi:hypothetical protein
MKQRFMANEHFCRTIEHKVFFILHVIFKITGNFSEHSQLNTSAINHTLWNEENHLFTLPTDVNHEP